MTSVGGRPMTSVGGPTVWGLGLFGGDVGERERREVFFKVFFLLLHVRGGKGRRGIVSFKTTSFQSLFFFSFFI